MVKTHFFKASSFSAVLAAAALSLSVWTCRAGAVPVVSWNQNSTLSKATFRAWTDPAFHYWFSTTNTSATGMSEVGGAGIDEQGAYPPLQVSFMVSNCLAFEWESQNLAYGNCMVS